jgi:RHS repeat-associated protein
MSGGVNNSRLTSMTYPSLGQQQRRVITYNYATSVDDRISRLTSISDGATTLESLSYLGLGTVVIRSYPQTGTELTYVKLSGESNGDAGDQYTGLDRFGRVVDQRWIITSSGVALDRWQYGYDRDGNVLYSNNLVNSNFSELYHANGAGNDYDNLNQLTNFARGTLNQTNDTISSPTHSITWGFDALGNWTSVNTDGSNQTRTGNQQNEITSISGQTTPGYDANGNTTTDQNGKTLVYDAWNRLVAYKNGVTVLQAYSFDALNRRITENPGTLRDLYYDSSWQLLEEDVSGSMADQYVWSSVYIDALIERDTPTLRMYVQENSNFDVTSLVDTSGNVQERYIYDPFGSVTILASNWTTRSNSNYGWVYFHQGGRYDLATGLSAFRNRDYSPTLGRWLENDPIAFRGRDTNLYRYVNNNPVTLSDPTGNSAWWDWIPIVSTIGHFIEITWLPPEGTNVLDYATCKPWADECKKDADSAIANCESCIRSKVYKYVLDWCGVSLPSDVLRGFGAAVGFAICKNGIKYGIRGGVGGAVTGGVLAIDGAIDAGLVIDGIARILLAAREASGKFCTCCKPGGAAGQDK